MLRGKQITLLAIAYNEERLIVPTIKAAPEYIDTILIVDDCSTDSTPQRVLECAKLDSRVQLIRHKKNRGPGGAIISGYMWAYLNGADIVVVIGGDNQMDQSEMFRFVIPIASSDADYCKGNRFLVDAISVMPAKRLFGNTTLSILTVLFSGYWGIFDTQDGYTAISRDAIEKIKWQSFHEGYGYVSDFIIRMKSFGLRIRDIPRRSIYLKGERQSQINIGLYIRKFFPLGISALRWRLQHQQHPGCTTTKLFANKRRELWEDAL